MGIVGNERGDLLLAVQRFVKPPGVGVAHRLAPQSTQQRAVLNRHFLLPTIWPIDAILSVDAVAIHANLCPLLSIDTLSWPALRDFRKIRFHSQGGEQFCQRA
jgi:hypothetical protein